MTAPDEQSFTFITNQPWWYGSHSGYYTQLPHAFRILGHDVRTTTPCDGMPWRIAGKLWAVMFGLPRRRQTLTIDELKFHSMWVHRPKTIGAILGMEHHLPALRYWRKAPRRLIGTLHHPRAMWTEGQLDALRRLASALVLYRSDLDFFAGVIGQDRVRFAYHGVDVAFFRPPEPNSIPSTRPILLCVGQFGRDYAQLDRVGTIILDEVPDAEIHVVAACFARAREAMKRLAGHPRVRFFSGLSDDEMLRQYQAATLMILPMTACGANNAVVEALASGLPLVTTDVGGIRDYGGGTVFPVVPKDVDEALVDQALALLRNGPERERIGFRAREFAVSRLAWVGVAADHYRVYCELAS